MLHSTYTEQAKTSQKYVCESCVYSCRKKSNYDAHLMTLKHINTDKYFKNKAETSHNIENIKYECKCGKSYKHRQSLHSHTKKCILYIKEENIVIKKEDNEDNEDKDEEEEENKNNDELHNNSNLIIEILKQNQEFKEMILEKPIPADTNDSLIIELLKQNQDFKNLMIEQNKYMMEQSKQMMELAKNAGNHNNNTTNNKFNMQIFLNETCKDAMNITEFVNSLVLTFKDLEDLGRYGYTQGITNIFTRGLQATEISKRPIHCSDMKRLIIYINDTNGWEKDNSSQEKVVQLIRKIAGKNLRQATEWMRINHSMIHGPDSYEQRQYLKMISQWFGGTDEENVKIYNKIIRNIAPQCYIDKYPALK